MRNNYFEEHRDKALLAYCCEYKAGGEIFTMFARNSSKGYGPVVDEEQSQTLSRLALETLLADQLIECVTHTSKHGDYSFTVYTPTPKGEELYARLLRRFDQDLAVNPKAKNLKDAKIALATIEEVVTQRLGEGNPATADILNKLRQTVIKQR